MKLYIAINYGSEGWALNPVENEAEAIKDIISGGTYGNEFKVLKEIEIALKEDTDGE